MTDEAVNQYVRRVESALRVSPKDRRRALEEIRGHLEDGIADHTDHGATEQQAVALAVAELGEPQDVAASFNDNAARDPLGPESGRWLPLVAPALWCVVSVAWLVGSARWFADGWTRGERTVQARYALGAVAAGALTVVTYATVRRGRRDRAWRQASWACGALAVAAAFLGPW